MGPDLRLSPLRTDDEADARAAHEELAREDFGFLLGWDPREPWAGYVARLRRQRCGLDVPDGWVPATFLVARVGSDLVGRISIRHELDAELRDWHGHIGYGVRPAHRRRGHATEMLRQGLVVIRAEGVDEVMVTCDDENAASALVIERAGGVLEDVRTDPDGVPTRRYWIS